MGKRKVPPFFLFRLPTFLVVQQSPALKLFLVMQGDAISHSKVVDLSLYTLLYSFEENKSPTRKCVDLNLHLRQTPLQGGQNLYRLPQNDCHCQLFPAITILPGTWSNSVAAVRIFISEILSLKALLHSSDPLWALWTCLNSDSTEFSLKKTSSSRLLSKLCRLNLSKGPTSLLRNRRAAYRSLLCRSKCVQ